MENVTEFSFNIYILKVFHNINIFWFGQGLPLTLLSQGFETLQDSHFPKWEHLKTLVMDASFSLPQCV
jgi:hypothetical protein